MPFINHGKPIKELEMYKKLSIRGSKVIDKLVRKVIKEIEVNLMPGKSYIYILQGIPKYNSNPPQICLVPKCQELGLNFLEIQSWLDNPQNFIDGLDRFDHSCLADFDERKMYFKMSDKFYYYGGCPSAFLYHTINSKT